MNAFDLTARDHPPFEPLLAGTVALMTCYGDTPLRSIARKVSANLSMLAEHPSCSAPLRRALLMAQADWIDRCGRPRSAVAALPAPNAPTTETVQ